MITYTDLKNTKLEHSAVALGKFDGLHRGHQLLFEKLSAYKKKGLTAVIFTFDFHPASLLSGKIQQIIYSRAERHAIIESLGADVLVEFPFTKETAHMSPEDFVREILVDRIGAEAIVVGNDFHFGYKRSGDVAFLKEREEVYGYQVDHCEKLCYLGEEISSTRIRGEIADGNMEMTTELLGRPYSISGPVVHGKENGRTIGMPTANVAVDRFKLLPPDGVYASRTLIRDDHMSCLSLTNIGTNPTVGAGNPRTIETYLLDYSGDLYDKEIELQLYKRLRPEETFASLEELRQQVVKDEQQAREYFMRNPV